MRVAFRRESKKITSQVFITVMLRRESKKIISWVFLQPPAAGRLEKIRFFPIPRHYFDFGVQIGLYPLIFLQKILICLLGYAIMILSGGRENKILRTLKIAQCKEQSKNFLKSFQKVLDKMIAMWYNKNVNGNSVDRGARIELVFYPLNKASGTR